MKLNDGEKVWDEWTAYEVVWVCDNRFYLWGYTQKGEDVCPTDLPEPVWEVYDFVQRTLAPIMVYRFPRGNDDYEGYCSHSNANTMQLAGFGKGSEWLKERGFISEVEK